MNFDDVSSNAKLPFIEKLNFSPIVELIWLGSSFPIFFFRLITSILPVAADSFNPPAF